MEIGECGVFWSGLGKVWAEFEQRGTNKLASSVGKLPHSL